MASACAPPSIARHALGAQPGHARRRAPGGGPDGPRLGGRARPHARSARGQRVVGGRGLGSSANAFGCIEVFAVAARPFRTASRLRLRFLTVMGPFRLTNQQPEVLNMGGS